ncbi:MAG: hypothetical protein V4701_03515 [Pseudomonadota bacterium]
MTLSQPAPIAETDDAINRLNPVERDLLGLLGRGHTAKSIATLRSMSEAAVNERFRSARRKTGIGSSREIARLIVAQENRHDFIDLVCPAAPPPELRRPDTHRRASPPRWRLPMSAAVLLAAAILAQQTATPPERPVPPAATSMFMPTQPSPDLVSLRAEVTAGPADPEWSPATQAALLRAYQRATDASVTLDVTCSRSLCEVLGVSRSRLTGAEIDTLLEAVQHPSATEALQALKLENIVQSYSTSEPVTERGAASVVFAAYWRRTD